MPTILSKLVENGEQLEFSFLLDELSSGSLVLTHENKII